MSAFNAENLAVLCYAKGFTLWHYKASGIALAAVMERGFFDGAIDLFAVGDMVMISAADGGRIAYVLEDDGAIVLGPVA